MIEFIYLQSVPGHLVTRFGSKSLIGAFIEVSEVESKGRFPKTLTEPKWNDESVAIPKTEYDRFRREYTRCIREGSLVLVPVKAQKTSIQKDK